MKHLGRQLKPLFIEAISNAFPELEGAELLNLVTVEDPRDPSHGDYSCAVALRLSKVLGKTPQEIGQAIIDSFPRDARVGELAFAAPGFVNIKLSTRFLEESLKELELAFNVEGAGSKKQPVIVEYPSTNAAKHMGVHHILTTVIGDALANLLEFMGYEVLRINHFGDWGTHFGKLIYAIEQWGDREIIHKNPTDELNALYVRFNMEAKEKSELEDEARAIFKSLEEGDAERKKLWEWIVQESIQELEKTLARMGVEVDMHMGESFYLKMADDILKDGIQKALFVEGEEGALIFDMGEGQTPALIQKSDGTTLYLTRDVATVKYRVETWHPEAILYVVDHAQSLHFKQDFAIARALGYVEAGTSLEHISFGRMNFANGRMSSRTGNVIKMNDLLDEAKDRAGKIAAERGSELPREELAALMETVGMGSLKYGILAQDRNRDILFDWDKIITLEGNSAPYLLYSYARAFSIVDKVDGVELRGVPQLTEEAELALIRRLIKFPQVLETALAERKPHVICTYLYELCQEFNRFYGKVSVAQAENEVAKRARLGLVHAFLHQLKAGLSILGIPVLERM